VNLLERRPGEVEERLEIKKAVLSNFQESIVVWAKLESKSVRGGQGTCSEVRYSPGLS